MNHGFWLTDGTTENTQELVDLAVEAEEAGWDGVFVSDSLPFAEFPDPWVLLAGIAARTDSIRLGTWVVPIPRRQPWQFAQEVATLDRLADGRLIVGAGLGNDPDYDAFGTPYDPPRLGDRFDEALEIIDRLWAGGPVDYHGDHFTLEDAEVHPTPQQEPRVPLLMGAWWPNKKPLQRGAEWDGIMPFFASLTGDGTGPHGEMATADPADEARELLEYYLDIADDPGEILLPSVPVDDEAAFLEEMADLGVTWALSTDLGEDVAEMRATIRDGPPV